VKTPGSGSDHAPFAFYANIPAIKLGFKHDKQIYKGLVTYPTYHTGYETFYLMDKLVDPGFKIHKTCAQVQLFN
jgi:N-acetylated-alpha-linked acidic dipeptidase